MRRTLTDPQPIPSLPYASGHYLLSRDIEHLNLLALFHYIGGGLTLLFACIPFIHVTLGVLMLSGKLNGPQGQPGPPPAFGWFFVIIGLTIIALGWTMGILIIYSGRCLKARRHWLFSVVMAGLMCLSVPLGTILGVFTLIVLLREPVKRLYGVEAPSPYPPQPGY